MSRSGRLSKRIQCRQLAAGVFEVAVYGNARGTPASRDWSVSFAENPASGGGVQLTICELSTGHLITSGTARTPDDFEVAIVLARAAATHGMAKSILLSKTDCYSVLLRRWCELNGIPLNEELDFTGLVVGAALPASIAARQLEPRFRWVVSVKFFQGRRSACLAMIDDRTLFVAAVVLVLPLTKAALVEALEGASERYGVPSELQVDGTGSLSVCVARWASGKGVRITNPGEPPPRSADDGKSPH